MADDRRIFPVATVLELVTGRKDAQVKEIASYILGRPLSEPVEIVAGAPFAAAWLARWYPRFMDMDWSSDQNWEAFVRQAKSRLGDNVSLTPMSGRLKALADKVLDTLAESTRSLASQTDATMQLEKRVRELEPLEAELKAAQNKCETLEEKLKTAKADMGALQRKVNEYQGKVAIDHDELMQNIKDAIKDGLKGIAVAAPAAGAASDEQPQEKATEEPAFDDFGFGARTDSDGFGF